MYKRKPDLVIKTWDMPIRKKLKGVSGVYALYYGDKLK